MKKFLSMLLAVVLVLSLGTVAFADGETKTYTDESTKTLTKTYAETNEGTESPAEKFSFSTLVCTNVKDAAAGVTTGNAPVPTINTVDFGLGAAGNAKDATVPGVKDATITLPTYTSVGVYTYKFTENAGTTAGVEYYGKDIYLKVTVIEDNGQKRVAAIHLESADGNKEAAITNTYSAGSLAVTKNVTGLLGDKTKEFKVTVTFTAPSGKTVGSTIYYTDGTEKTIAPSAWTTANDVTTATAEITLKHGETVTFTNIPYGVTYSVKEADYSGDGYTTTYDETVSGTISSASASTTITNNKGADPDTGITLDSMPYVVMLVVVCAGLFVVLAKKRAAREN